MSTLYTTYTQDIIATYCGVCQVPFGLAANHMRSLEETHESFWCPRGCVIRFTGKSTSEKLRDELQQQKDRTAKLTAQLDQRGAELRDKERSLAARKAVTTRLRNRLKKGVCPCCSKAFPNMKQHLKKAHPKWNTEKEVRSRLDKTP